MNELNPLAPPPADSPVAAAFLRHAGIQPGPPDRLLLARLAGAFARLPYENITKILKTAAVGRGQQARRAPQEVLDDHAQWGAGGTCFSLTATFLHILRALGYEAQPLLADRRYGADTHSAMVVQLEGRPHLLDPGYLILQPVPLDAPDEQRVQTSFNELRLIPRDGGLLDLHTVHRGNDAYRLSFKLQPVDAGRFLRAWDSSFGWDMMRYPVLTRVNDGRQIYIQGRRLQLRDRESVLREQLAEDAQPQEIARHFGLRPALVARALETLQRQGERDGPA